MTVTPHIDDDSRKLTVRVVGSVTNRFNVPAYQRGYRWERKQVRQLLDDIERNGNAPYYLQPVVVAPNDKGGVDLIDGQQRLTTIMLIYKMLSFKKNAFDKLKSNEAFLSAGVKIDNPLEKRNVSVPYSIEYETRHEETSAFIAKLESTPLSELYEESRNTPDTLYMWHACDEISTWFDGSTRRIEDTADALNKYVKIIWYALDQAIDCWEKFADLNVGKIPLTNSELIKALFMRDDGRNKISDHDKAVIVDQWDSIERELNDKTFWNFLTNRKMTDYDTKIDLLFDIVAGKKPDERDEFFTFLHFEKKYEANPESLGKGAWNEIYLQYLRLRDWYEDPTNELYHKIGFLVTVDGKDEVLSELFEFSKGRPHNELHEEIDRRIKSAISLPIVKSKTADGEDIEQQLRLRQLQYGAHNSLIQNILTLFNVLTVQGMADKTQRYSFYHHKNVSGGWSLEHIHAQKSDLLNTEEQWTKWVDLHKKSLHRYKDMKVAAGASETEIIAIDALYSDMEKFLASSKRDRNQIAFNRISGDFARIAVSNDKRTNVEYKDEMANMALLSKDVNSLLNNSVFDVKRGLIQEAMSKDFIPVCTQRVFLKTYTSQDENQLFFWGDNDRRAYIDQMEATLKKYLPQGYVTEIMLQEESMNEQNNKEPEN